MDPISWFDGHDAEMIAAVRKAQDSLPQFIAEMEKESRRVVPAIDEAIVKYAFAADAEGVEVEHMFLSDIEIVDGLLSGTVASEPLYSSQVAEGDVVDIEPSRVSDWIYVIDGVGTGGFTFRLMWARFSEQEKATYGGQPPFVWLTDT